MKFSKALFNTTIFPLSQPIQCSSINDLKARYQNTLEKYESFFGEAPPSNIWEASENRFIESFSRVSVNLYRLTVAKCLHASSVKAFIIEKNQTKNHTDGETLEDTKIIENERKKAIENNETYGWRKQYYHCKDIYIGEEFIVTKGGPLPNPNEAYKRETTVFQPGGVLIFPNPFKIKAGDAEEVAEIISGSFYSTVEATQDSELTLDDLADMSAPRCIAK